MKETQLQKTDEQLINLLTLVESVEFENQQLQVFEGLKAGNAALKSIHEVCMYSYVRVLGGVVIVSGILHITSSTTLW